MSQAPWSLLSQTSKISKSWFDFWPTVYCLLTIQARAKLYSPVHPMQCWQLFTDISHPLTLKFAFTISSGGRLDIFCIVSTISCVSMYFFTPPISRSSYASSCNSRGPIFAIFHAAASSRLASILFRDSRFHLTLIFSCNLYTSTTLTFYCYWLHVIHYGIFLSMYITPVISFHI